MKRTWILVFLLFYPHIVLALSEKLSYKPQIVEPIAEHWLWTEIEQLKNKGFRAMTNGPDGTIYFGTEQGIYHYDGYDLKHYGQNDGLDGTMISSLYLSRSGDMYATTTEGMYKFKNGFWQKLFGGTYRHFSQVGFAEDSNKVIWARSDQGIIRIEGDKAELVQKFESIVMGVAVDKNDSLWITILDYWLVYECPVRNYTKEFIGNCVTHVPNATLSNQAVKFFPFADSKYGVWMIDRFPDGGISYYNLNTKIWTHYDLKYPHTSILESYDGAIFVASQKVLHKFEDGEWSRYKIEGLHYNITSSNIMESPDGRLWIGGTSGDVFSIDRSTKHAQVYKGVLYQDETKHGKLWFLGKNDEILSFDRHTKEWTQHSDENNIIDTPITLLVVESGNVVVAGSDGSDTALSVYDGVSWKKKVIENFSPSVYYRSLFQSKDRTIYLGNGFDNLAGRDYSGGLVKIRLSPGGDIKVQRLSPPHVPEVVKDFVQTADSNLWFASGVAHILENDRSRLLDNVPEKFKKSGYTHLVSGGVDNIWLAKFGLGLASFNGFKWTTYPTEHSIGTNSISYVLPVGQKELYVATFNGIVYFDGETWNRNFLPESFKFQRGGGAIKRDSAASLWFTYSTNYWYERAKVAKDKKHVEFPQIRSVRYSADSFPPIVKIQSYSAEIENNGRQFITWKGFDKWGKTPADGILYSYSLNQDEWTPFVAGQNITLSEFADGIHRFKLRAKDSDGNISVAIEEIKFTVLPPIWKQLWFLSLIGSLLASIIGLIALIIRLREKHLIALDKIRIEFFTNITHELRTPLTVILGPLERLRAEIVNPNHAKLINLAHRSSRRLLELVDQVLEIRKIETGNEVLKLEQGDPVVFLKEAFAYYMPLAKDKRIQVKQYLPTDSSLYSFDKDKLQKIVDNLITNAVKYTEEGGNIILRVSLERENSENATTAILNFEIEDTGIGIAPEAQKDIFNSYFRAKSESDQSGFGIGLAFVKKLIETCGGEISLKSPVNLKTQTGTLFRVRMPMPLVNTDTKTVGINGISQHENMQDHLYQELDIVASGTQDLPLLLIIEDNIEIREYLKIELHGKYKIIEAGDGLQGLAMAKEQVPDIIVSDIMMPEMDGIECCRKLKTDEVTSHIPVIILTARRSRDSELEGLETGADDYISKPLDIDVLKVRLHNQLVTRRKLQKKYSVNPSVEIHTIANNSTDRLFLNRLVELVEKQIEDPDFDVHTLAGSLNFSRTTLYRKIKAISGESPSRFVRLIRLKKAAALLQTGRHTISDTLNLVGFQDLSYFSKCFKAQFGETPSNFVQKIHGADTDSVADQTKV